MSHLAKMAHGANRVRISAIVLTMLSVVQVMDCVYADQDFSERSVKSSVLKDFMGLTALKHATV